MTQTLLRQNEVITGFREKMPAGCATARAIDREEPWERIALQAADDGFIEFANALIEACLRRPGERHEG